MRSAARAGAAPWAWLWLALIVAAAAGLRLHGLWWDEGQLFHPDERWMVMVADQLGWPASIGAWHPVGSPLNPFWDPVDGEGRRFAYGHLPLYLVRLLGGALVPVASPLGLNPERSYEYLVFLGRLLAVGADLLTVVLTYVLGRRLSGPATGLLAAAGVALTTLHVQLAHFFTTDPLLGPSVLGALLATMWLAEGGGRRAALTAGTLIGLAVGTKFSAISLLVPLLLAHAVPGLGPGEDASSAGVGVGAALRARWAQVRRHGSWQLLPASLGAALLAFGLTNPYALLDPYHLALSLGNESGMVQGRWVFPYTEQYRGTWPYVYHISQQLRWFVGPTFGLLAWTGGGWVLLRLVRREVRPAELPLMVWMVLYFATVGGAFVKFPRYMVPLSPLLFIFGSALWLGWLADRRRQALFAVGVIAPALLLALAFTTIYSERHPWIQASAWLYRHVEADELTVVELWDHTLPVAMDVDGAWRRPREVKRVVIDPFDPVDANPERLSELLAEAEWLILASPRNWLTLSRAESPSPLMRAFYARLLAGEAGYEIVWLWRVEPRLGPLSLADNPFASAGLPTPAIWHAAAPAQWTLSPGPADESYAVYDHPLPLLLRKREALSASELRARLWPEQPHGK